MRWNSINSYTLPLPLPLQCKSVATVNITIVIISILAITVIIINTRSHISTKENSGRHNPEELFVHGCSKDVIVQTLNKFRPKVHLNV